MSPRCTAHIRRTTARLAFTGALTLAGSTPAFADGEIDALKQELAEQKQLIQSLLAAQAEQKKINAKIVAVPPIDQNTAAPVASNSSYGFYGIVDVNVNSTDAGYGRKTEVGTGGLTSSLFGIKGEKYLGDGFKAVGLAETGLLLNTGNVGNGSAAGGLNTAPSSGGQLGNGAQLLSRQVYVGASSDRFGTLTVGRQYTASYGSGAMLNALSVGFYGTSGGILPLSGGMPTRLNNSIVYFTPRLSGLGAQIDYSTGSQNNVSGNVATAAGATTKTNDRAGKGGDVAITYNNGPLFMTVTAWDWNATSFAATETGLARKKGVQIGGSYDFGPVKLFATAIEGRINGGNYENVTKTLSKSSGWSVSGWAPFGKNKVYFSYTSFNDQSSLNRDAKALGLAYSYQIYPGTKLYAAWGKIQNNRNASYNLTDGGDLVNATSAAGVQPSGTMAGVNYTF